MQFNLERSTFWCLMSLLVFRLLLFISSGEQTNKHSLKTELKRYSCYPSHVLARHRECLHFEFNLINDSIGAATTLSEA